MWQLTGDLSHVIHGVGWTCSQNVSPLALTVWVLWCFEDLEEKDSELIYQIITKLFVEKPGYTGSGKYLEGANVPMFRNTCICTIGSWSVKFFVWFLDFCIKLLFSQAKRYSVPRMKDFCPKYFFLYRSLRRRHFFKSGACKLFLHDIVQSNSIQGWHIEVLSLALSFCPNVNSSGFYNNKTAVHSLKVAVQMCNFSVFYYKFYRFII